MGILEGLTPQQREAVLTTDGPLLILAGAGSGKTRVLTHRIAYLVKECGVAPAQILAITFTNKAAREMRQRVEDLLQAESRGMWVMTFHAACARILRREIHALGFGQNFTIYDTTDQRALVRDCLRELNWDLERFPPDTCRIRISAVKNRLWAPAEAARQAGDYFEQRVAELYQFYQQRLRENNALDFDDLLLVTVQLFAEHPDVLDKYQRRFRYLSIDEYQDTNHAQYVLAQQLAAAHRNICVVGDDFQAIYGFRGADLTNILEFENDYPDARVIKLEENHRSSGNILAAANAVMRHNRMQKEKSLWTSRAAGEPITLYTAASDEEEARFVTGEILTLHQRGVPLSDCAVFYRTHAQSRVLEEAFVLAGIPHVVIGSRRFFERKEIKDLIAYLRVLQNPHDDFSLARIINTPRRGVGQVSLERLGELAAREGLSLFATLPQAAAAGVRGKALTQIKAFHELLADLLVLRHTVALDILLREIGERTGYFAELRADGSPEALSRLENIDELLRAAAAFRSESEEDELTGFLAQVALLSSADDLADDSQGAVSLLTLHSAKGLEFPVVFMVGMEEGVFPHQRSLDDQRELEEERRLCYVGITRAEERLYLSYARQRNMFGTWQYHWRSRFLDEIPTELVQERGAVGPSPSPTPHRKAAGPFALGDAVQHEKWGEGKVVSVKGEGDNQEVAVAFPGRGIKQLLVAYAPLSKL
ncbi:MAG: DNA helicase PcrA [Bacillota bacterium]